MKKKTIVRLLSFFFAASGTCVLFYSCFKDLPKKQIVYQNDFEKNIMNGLKVNNGNGLIDSVKIVDFNGTKVAGRFNNNYVYLKLKNLPDHNALKIEFDLYIHDKWDK